MHAARHNHASTNYIQCGAIFALNKNPGSHSQTPAYRHLTLVLHVGLVADDEAHHLLRIGGETVHVLQEEEEEEEDEVDDAE